MPNNRRVHWPDRSYPPRPHHRIRERSSIALGGSAANMSFRRPDALTAENLEQVPLAGFHTDVWSWCTWPGNAPDARRYGGGEGGHRDR